MFTTDTISPMGIPRMICHDSQVSVQNLFCHPVTCKSLSGTVMKSNEVSILSRSWSKVQDFSLKFTSSSESMSLLRSLKSHRNKESG